jgi:hypothetical protein
MHPCVISHSLMSEVKTAIAEEPAVSLAGVTRRRDCADGSANGDAPTRKAGDGAVSAHAPSHNRGDGPLRADAPTRNRGNASVIADARTRDSVDGSANADAPTCKENDDTRSMSDAVAPKPPRIKTGASGSGNGRSWLRSPRLHTCEG